MRNVFFSDGVSTALSMFTVQSNQISNEMVASLPPAARGQILCRCYLNNVYTFNATHLFHQFFICNIFKSAENVKKQISAMLTKENPKQRPSMPPMFAMNVARDIT